MTFGITGFAQDFRFPWIAIGATGSTDLAIGELGSQPAPKTFFRSSVVRAAGLLRIAASSLAI